MITREDIFTYVKETYKTVPDHPWTRDPDSAVLRHKNGKWYGLIMSIPAGKLGLPDDKMIDIINLKCDPEISPYLRTRTGIYPAYHMNKEHWITVILNGLVPLEELYPLIDASFELTG